MGAGEEGPGPLIVAYRVELHREAIEALAALPGKIRRQVARKIEALGAEPTPPGSMALKGRHAGLHRVRSGDYRILYQVEKRRLVVLVVKIGNRRDVYR